MRSSKNPNAKSNRKKLKVEIQSMFNVVSPSVDEFYNRNVDGVLYVSHASILVSLTGRKFLFDPVLAKPPHLGSWVFYPEMQRDYRMLEVDGVFVSHQHQDHYDVEFLKLLPRSTAIYVVAGRPQFSKMLTQQGIQFIELHEGRKIDLGNGISCTGILHEYNGIDAAIAISNDKFTVYHGNDCFVSNDKLKIIKDAYPKIDVACVPFAYVHWYPFLLEDVDSDWKKQEADRLIDKYLQYGLRQVEFLKPEVAIPFGANMFYFDDISSDHNKAVRSPFDFKRYAVETDFQLEKSIVPLFSGDIVFSAGDKHRRSLEIIKKPYSEDALHSGFKEFLERAKAQGVGFDFSEIENTSVDFFEDLSFISRRLGAVDGRPDHRIIISNSENQSLGFIVIDLKSCQVEKLIEIDESQPFHHFRLTDLAYKAYLSQKYSLNEVVASSRFRLVRRPNEYRLDVLKIINNAL